VKTTAAFAFAILVLALPARAQDAPVIQIRSAFGASTYLHGDIGYTAPLVLVSARIGTRAVTVEPEFAYAWHEDTATFPGGHHERRAHFESIGINVVRRWPGTLTPYVGGGVGVFTDRERTTSVSSTFGTHVSDRTRGPVGGVQALGGVDVRVSSRLNVFGQGRYEVRSLQDPGGGSVWQVMGGIAITLK